MATRPAPVRGVRRAEDRDAAGEQDCQEKDPHVFLHGWAASRHSDPQSRTSPLERKTWGSDHRFAIYCRVQMVRSRPARSEAGPDSWTITPGPMVDGDVPWQHNPCLSGRAISGSQY
jgi:hypothetical protein